MNSEVSFVDGSGASAKDGNTYWSPIVVPKARIDAEIERLASLPMPHHGRRESLIVHPMAPARAPGLAPGIQVKLSVLKPGEESAPFRHNATEVHFCIAGEGISRIGNENIAFTKFDIWNHPSHTTYTHRNTGQGLQVRLTYSNVPLLQCLEVYLAEDLPAPEPPALRLSSTPPEPSTRSPFGTIPIGADGAMLMPYETLIHPVPVESRALHFPWSKVKTELDALEALGKSYAGRRLYMMYNPMTARFNGITPNFFATMTIRPAGIVDRPHRHVSAAINYYFSGRGFSKVAGHRYEWAAGDLMLSAPGWAVHNHGSYDERVYELTVQDQPLHLFMESLLWQEEMKHPPRLLGSNAGFSTNRQKALP